MKSATLIKSNSESKQLIPANGKYFTLEEMQGFVDGLIEILYLKDGSLMIVNENGLNTNLPINDKATDIRNDNYGKSIYPIVGNVLVTPKDFVR